MKMRIWDRLLSAISGLLLVAVGVLLLVRESIPGLLDFQPLGKSWFSSPYFYISIVMIMLGLHLVSYLFRGLKKKNSLVIQKTDYGELTISVKAIEGMVLKCTQDYQEVELLQSDIKNSREGIVVQLKVALAKDVNIPLAINAMQKHIKQYVTSCSGIEVGQVQVEVVSTDSKKPKGKFAIETPQAQPFINEADIIENQMFAQEAETVDLQTDHNTDEASGETKNEETAKEE